MLASSQKRFLIRLRGLQKDLEPTQFRTDFRPAEGETNVFSTNMTNSAQWLRSGRLTLFSPEDFPKLNGQSILRVCKLIDDFELVAKSDTGNSLPPRDSMQLARQALEELLTIFKAHLECLTWRK
jgi:hypothetical protein